MTDKRGRRLGRWRSARGSCSPLQCHGPKTLVLPLSSGGVEPHIRQNVDPRCASSVEINSPEIVPAQLPLRPERNLLQTLCFSPTKQPTLWLGSVQILLRTVNLKIEGQEYNRNPTGDIYALRPPTVAQRAGCGGRIPDCSPWRPQRSRTGDHAGPRCHLLHILPCPWPLYRHVTSLFLEREQREKLDPRDGRPAPSSLGHLEVQTMRRRPSRLCEGRCALLSGSLPKVGGAESVATTTC